MSIGGKALDSLVDFCKSSKMCAPRRKLAALSRPRQLFRLACVCSGEVKVLPEAKISAWAASLLPANETLYPYSLCTEICFPSDPKTNTQHEC